MINNNNLIINVVVRVRVYANPRVQWRSLYSSALHAGQQVVLTCPNPLKSSSSVIATLSPSASDVTASHSAGQQADFNEAPLAERTVSS